MIGWWVAGGAVLIALLVVGFCAYEVLWRVRRLRRDAVALAALAPEVAAVQQRLRLVAIRSNAIGRSDAIGRSSTAGRTSTVIRPSVPGDR